MRPSYVCSLCKLLRVQPRWLSSVWQRPDSRRRCYARYFEKQVVKNIRGCPGPPRMRNCMAYCPGALNMYHIAVGQLMAGTSGAVDKNGAWPLRSLT
jgi:hypothetical protein